MPNRKERLECRRGDHKRILDELENAGVYPYGSEQVRTREDRLIKAILWPYRKAEKSC